MGSLPTGHPSEIGQILNRIGLDIYALLMKKIAIKGIQSDLDINVLSIMISIITDSDRIKSNFLTFLHFSNWIAIRICNYYI